MDLNKVLETNSISFTPVDNRRLAELCGQCDEHLRQVERQFGVEIHNRGNIFHIFGSAHCVQQAEKVLDILYQSTENNGTLTPAKVHLVSQEALNQKETKTAENHKTVIRTRYTRVVPRGENQAAYIQNILSHDINFAVGPAGTGKTYLAVACAIEALDKERVQRILLVRPAVEAGERLGFLPGDLAQKVDPYLRPLYDALYEMMGFERVMKLLEANIIEIAPLAYMRGRTLNDAFVILDESQNTTKEQMKMFLTRIGFGSIAVITGDLTQVDLPKGKISGLADAVKVLANIKGISFNQFETRDVVRHPLVQKIVGAYNRHERNNKNKEDE